MAENSTSSPAPVSLALLVAVLASLLFGVALAGFSWEAHRSAAIRTAAALRPLLGAALAEGEPEKVALLLETVRGSYSAAVYDAGGSLLVGSPRPRTPGHPVPPLPEKLGANVGKNAVAVSLDSPSEGGRLGTLYLRDDASCRGLLAIWAVVTAAMLLGAWLLSRIFQRAGSGPARFAGSAGFDEAAEEVTGLAHAVAADHDYGVRAKTHSPLVEAVNHMLASIGRRSAEREAEHRRVAEQAQELRATVDRLEKEKATAVGSSPLSSTSAASALDLARPELEASLRGIVGESAALLPRLSEPQRRFAAAIGHHGAHLLALVGETDPARPAEGPFDLGGLLEQLSSVFATRAAERGLGFSFEAVGALPRTVQGNSALLRRALLALVGNAFRFTERGQIELVAGAMRDRFRFELRDTAPLLPPEAGESDPRFVAGLADATRQIAALGGSLKFRAGPENVGNVFWFDIPLAPVA